MHSSLHELVAGDKGQLKIDPWKNFSDAGRLQEPVHTDFLHFVGNQGDVDGLLVIFDNHFSSRVFLRQLFHSVQNQHSKVIQDIRQQNEFLRIKDRTCNIVEQLGTLNCNSDAGNFVFLVPKLVHLLVETLKLVGEFLGRDHLDCFRRSRAAFGLKLVHSALSLSESDNSVGVSVSPFVNDDVLSICLLFELSKDPYFLCLPTFEALSAQHQSFQLLVVRERIVHSKFVRDRCLFSVCFFLVFIV